MAAVTNIMLIVLAASCTTVLGYGKSYEVVTQKMDWETASCYCRAKGHTLPVIQSAAEHQALVSYFEGLRKDGVLDGCMYLNKRSIWIAGQRVTMGNSRFVWKVTPTGSFSMKYTNWHRPTNEPNNIHGKEACAHVWEEFGWDWNDIPCGNQQCFVCELKV